MIWTSKWQKSRPLTESYFSMTLISKKSVTYEYSQGFHVLKINCGITCFFTTTTLEWLSEKDYIFNVISNAKNNEDCFACERDNVFWFFSTKVIFGRRMNQLDE